MLAAEACAASSETTDIFSTYQLFGFQALSYEGQVSTINDKLGSNGIRPVKIVTPNELEEEKPQFGFSHVATGVRRVHRPVFAEP
ncbi:hypothetical protein EVAR_97653_1 [Eumeta japonica]|uniref:Uncharacterized protein n=1 Tax=Eumeta variegata TaxID=151549 RepID=A0A4C1WYJ4_EUMVA|nr:hypothetical protein EVAR_97653_1 [Eumeta japonica]